MDSQTAASATSVPLSDVEKIVLKDRLVGFAYGLLLGAGIGALVGYAYLGGDTGGGLPGLTILGGMIAGGTACGISGYLIDTNIQFVFIPPTGE